MWEERRRPKSSGFPGAQRGRDHVDVQAQRESDELAASDQDASGARAGASARDAGLGSVAGSKRGRAS
jgi:hypothetical protein